jgi:hypothetical protein
MRRAKLKGAVTTVDVFAGSPADLPDVAAVLPYTDYFMPLGRGKQRPLTGYDGYR